MLFVAVLTDFALSLMSKFNLSRKFSIMHFKQRNGHLSDVSSLDPIMKKEAHTEIEEFRRLPGEDGLVIKQNKLATCNEDNYEDRLLIYHIIITSPL